MFPSENDPLFGVFVKNFKSELEKNGVEFPVTSLIKGKCVSTPKKIWRYTWHYFKSIKGGLSSRYDLIYVHFLSHHIPILFLFKAHKKPLVINMHGTDFIIIKSSKLLTSLSYSIIKRANILVVPTNYFKNIVLEHFKEVNANKIVISPSGGIDKNIFYEKKGKNELNKKVFTLGFVSRFIEEKGWLTFLECLNALKDKGIVFTALIAGKGPDESKIKASIKSMGLKSNITFLGLVEQPRLVDIYNTMDLYIFPTYRQAESLGLTGLEAMACGVPNIACNIAGPSTYIVHGENGFLFEPKKSLQLVNCVQAYLNMSNTEKQKMKIKALETSANYEKSYVAKELKNRLAEELK